jgi:glycosyltransferase involved in cell wall biosynthesis
MNVLFVHQNFPGQFKHLAPALARAGHQVRALAIDGAGLPVVPMQRYRPARGSTPGIHPATADFETKVIRGEACANAAMQLKQLGFDPDVIIANPGWGEHLFLKDVWNDARLLMLMEFFYAARGLDCNFDPEFATSSLTADARVRTKTANLLLALHAMDHGICPTQFQRSTMPAEYHSKLSVIFDGIDSAVVRPDAGAYVQVGRRTLRAGDEVITFINRNLEPMRGYHVFMRALPDILRERPGAVAIIVGGDDVSYGAAPPNGQTWKQIFFNEVKSRLDLDRVYFVGRIPYPDYLRVLQVSACHVYLTVPFVLGWSCIEAMSAGALVVGSDTAPVREVITHGRNGLLVNFFDTASLSRTVIGALARAPAHAALRAAARDTVLQRYDLATHCLPRQLSLVEQLANRNP